ncbi:ActS/PrrB/RegB family redox-sensitive histidine kinase [Pelagibacterales bacterium SAG-MED31]|nr:ActS/PrrB/RegB family redox-sensitive histidine kinase [Pelagibacterales bacterium SAG-MED31]
MNTILLTNLIKIRWIAIFGQFTAIFFVHTILEIKLLLVECILVILFSVLINLGAFFFQKKDKISDKKVFFFLLFDTTQLGILLFLNGGILNPFSILVLAPVIISATYLKSLWTVFLSAYSIFLVIIIKYFFISLNWKNDFIIPKLYNNGLLISLIVTIIFIAVYAYLFASSSRKISKALSEIKLQLNNQRKITEIGSLSAAAVHELSTPLNTIFLILNDLLKEEVLIQNKNLLKDVTLLKSQAKRCSDILLSLSKNPYLLKDNFFEKIKIEDLLKLSFEKFNTTKALHINFEKTNRDLTILYKDEINYAFSNIIQNAIQHSINKVLVNIILESNELSVKITDDGNGFSREILDKLGEPYITKTKKGMGLGIFIAKNLIENVGGRIYFYNSSSGNAVVEIFLKGSILKK